MSEQLQENKKTPSHSIVWEAHEYEFSPKSTDWYWALWIVSVALAIACILLKDILLGVVVLLSAFTISLLSARPPQIIECGIDRRGVRTGKIIYPYETIDSFWIDESAHRKHRILLKSRKMLMPYIVITLENTDPEEVRKLLNAHIPEIEHHESIFHMLFEYFGIY